MRVDHDGKEQRFVAKTDAGEAELTYTRPRRGVLDLQHTFVPEEARGNGVANALAAAAFRYARDRSEKIVPTCEFVAEWVRSHPEEADLVIDE